MTVPDRRAARVVLVDDADRILLLRGGDPARPEATAETVHPGELADLLRRLTRAG